MKTEIINYLSTDRSYRAGVSLVMKYSPKLALKRQLNIQQESDFLKGCVFEELRELANIPFLEMNKIISAPLPKVQKAKGPELEVPVKSVPSNVNIHEGAVEGQKNPVAKPKNKKPSPEVKKVGRKK